MQSFIADFTQNRVHHNNQSDGYISFPDRSLPSGADTFINSAVFNTFCVPGTKYPSIIPKAIANKIHNANLSKKDRLLSTLSVFVSKTDGSPINKIKRGARNPVFQHLVGLSISQGHFLLILRLLGRVLVPGLVVLTLSVIATGG